MVFCLYLDVFRSDLGCEETRAWGGQNQGACLDCKRPLKPLKVYAFEKYVYVCTCVCVCISEEKEFVSTPAPAQCAKTPLLPFSSFFLKTNFISYFLVLLVFLYLLHHEVKSK